MLCVVVQAPVAMFRYLSPRGIHPMVCVLVDAPKHRSLDVDSKDWPLIDVLGRKPYELCYIPINMGRGPCWIYFRGEAPWLIFWVEKHYLWERDSFPCEGYDPPFCMYILDQGPRAILDRVPHVGTGSRTQMICDWLPMDPYTYSPIFFTTQA